MDRIDTHIEQNNTMIGIARGLISYSMRRSRYKSYQYEPHNYGRPYVEGKIEELFIPMRFKAIYDHGGDPFEKSVFDLVISSNKTEDIDIRFKDVIIWPVNNNILYHKNIVLIQNFEFMSWK